MPGHDDFHPHFRAAVHDRIEIVHLEPQQYAVPVWLVIAVADRAVMVFYIEIVQLKNKLAVPHQLLVFFSPVIALTAQQTLIPSTACFHIGYRDHRLRTHASQHIAPWY